MKAEMPCFAAHKRRFSAQEVKFLKIVLGEKIEAHVESTGDKKIALVINNVKVSEVKPIMDFIHEMREKQSV